MTLAKQESNKIASDWITEFPQLNIYSQNKFYRIAGCVILGIELIKIPRSNNYRPHFVLYSLCKSSLKECLDVPIVLQQFFDRKNFQLDIPLDKHTMMFKDAVEIVKKQFPVLLLNTISVNDIFSVINNYSGTKRFSIAPNSYFQGEFMQTKLEIELFSTNVIKAQQILNEIKKRDWDQEHFIACGVDLKDWIENLQNEIHNQELLLKRVDINKADKKLAKIKV